MTTVFFAPSIDLAGVSCHTLMIVGSGVYCPMNGIILTSKWTLSGLKSWVWAAVPGIPIMTDRLSPQR